MLRRAHPLALAGLLLLAAVLTPAVSAARAYLQLFVTAPYLELHTGPGRGYPVFHVVPRDGSIDVLFRRTDWFKVRTERGVEGWASQTDMQKMVLADGSQFKFDLGDRAGFTSHRFEMGMFAGQYGGATLISGYSSFSFNPQLAFEVAVGQFLGNSSNGEIEDFGFAHVFVPEARWSPFVTSVWGWCRRNRRPPWWRHRTATSKARTSAAAYASTLPAGSFCALNTRQHWIFTTRNQNEDADEWKAGFAFFF